MIPSLFPPSWRFGQQWVEWGLWAKPNPCREIWGQLLLSLFRHLGQAGGLGRKHAGKKWTTVSTEAKGMEVRQ